MNQSIDFIFGFATGFGSGLGVGFTITWFIAEQLRKARHSARGEEQKQVAVLETQQDLITAMKELILLLRARR